MDPPASVIDVIVYGSDVAARLADSIRDVAVPQAAPAPGGSETSPRAAGLPVEQIALLVAGTAEGHLVVAAVDRLLDRMRELVRETPSRTCSIVVVDRDAGVHFALPRDAEAVRHHFLASDAHASHSLPECAAIGCEPRGAPDPKPTPTARSALVVNGSS